MLQPASAGTTICIQAGQTSPPHACREPSRISLPALPFADCGLRPVRSGPGVLLAHMSRGSSPRLSWAGRGSLSPKCQWTAHERGTTATIPASQSSACNERGISSRNASCSRSEAQERQPTHRPQSPHPGPCRPSQAISGRLSCDYCAHRSRCTRVGFLRPPGPARRSVPAYARRER